MTRWRVLGDISVVYDAKARRKRDTSAPANPLMGNVSVAYSAGDKHTGLCMINKLGVTAS
jgi:hypothetical protein